MMNQIEGLQLFSTLFLMGLIWFVQVVHYPLFSVVGNSPHYYSEHQRRTTWIVLPVMLTELASVLYLFYFRGTLSDQVGLVLLAGIWTSTFLLQVPCHRKLLKNYSPCTVKRLVRTNWIRTVFWTLRAFIILLY